MSTIELILALEVIILSNLVIGLVAWRFCKAVVQTMSLKKINNYLVVNTKTNTIHMKTITVARKKVGNLAKARELMAGFIAGIQRLEEGVYKTHVRGQVFENLIKKSKSEPMLLNNIEFRVLKKVCKRTYMAKALLGNYKGMFKKEMMYDIELTIKIK